MGRAAIKADGTATLSFEIVAFSKICFTLLAVAGRLGTVFDFASTMELEMVALPGVERTVTRLYLSIGKIRLWSIVAKVYTRL